MARHKARNTASRITSSWARSSATVAPVRSAGSAAAGSAIASAPSRSARRSLSRSAATSASSRTTAPPASADPADADPAAASLASAASARRRCSAASATARRALACSNAAEATSDGASPHARAWRGVPEDSAAAETQASSPWLCALGCPRGARAPSVCQSIKRAAHAGTRLEVQGLALDSLKRLRLLRLVPPQRRQQLVHLAVLPPHVL